jgi:hypothetical protein
MKKTTRGVLTILVFLMLVLSACTSESSTTEGSNSVPVATQTTGPTNQDLTAAAPTTAATQDTSGATALDTSYEKAVSVEMQLLLGTLNLTGDLAVTEGQASVLLPLWTDLKTVSMSMGPGQAQANATPQPQGADSETQAQVDALVSQIEAAMTPEQIEAIAAMKITQDSAMTIMQAQGLTMGGGSGNPPPSDGQPPSGSPQPSGGQPPSDGQVTAPPAGGGVIPPELFDALIQALGGMPSTAVATPSVPAGSGSATDTSGSISAAYTQTGGTETKTGGTYTASDTDQSAILVTGGGSLTLTGATITTSGDTSSNDQSSFYGLNAAVLANDASQITLSDSSITTSGTGANGAFAEGSSSSVTLSQVMIDATGDGGHGVMATNSGTMTLTDVDMTTAGKNSGAIATDRGGGTIVATGGTVTTSGQDSPGIYSTGDITISNGTISASGAEVAAIEGANSISLVDTDLSSSMADKWGVMIYQSMSGDAQGTRGVFTMSGGSLANTAATGPLFYVTNSTGVITLEGVQVTAASGTLLQAAAGRWGNSGSNGGTVLLTAEGQTLVGDMTADDISSITATLQNGSALTGAINAAHTAQVVNLTLDGSSTWTVTADSYLTCLSDPDGISGTAMSNIIGNGHAVYYDASACPALGGQTFTLNGEGTLQPAG